jgi:hypothetical protein
MSRNVIGAAVAVAIAALTAVMYMVATGSLGKPLERQAKALIKRAPEQANNNATLVALDTSNKVEVLAKSPGVLTALRTTMPDERSRAANLAFQEFRATRERDGMAPDLLALVDPTGSIVAMDGVSAPVAGEFKKDDKVAWRGLALALAQPTLLAEVWNYPGKGVMRVGLGTVVDDQALGPDGKPKILGAVVLAYAVTAKAAREQSNVLGTHIAYFDAGQVFATSFRRADDSEDSAMQAALVPILSQGELVATALAKGRAGKFVETTVRGKRYLVSAVRLPRVSVLAPLPADYPGQTAGLLVLTEADPGATEHGSAGMLILVLGVVAGVLAIGGILLATHRRMIMQVDRGRGWAWPRSSTATSTGRSAPVGGELDGLANGLNVMLARVLGRPEPGEEEFDEDGNPIIPGRVDFEEGEEKPAADPDLAALAQESEPDYYKRVYTDYLAQRKAAGAPDDVSFENFIAKLKVNEGKLRAQYNCRAVRFRVVTKDGKVTLKPVPIYA